MRIAVAVRGEREGGYRATGRSLSRGRAILRAMAGQGPLAIREIARRVERDVRAVHSDVRALHLSGVIDKTPEGRMILPYDVIRLDLPLDTQEAA
jgi:predicted transcriptional regulator